MPEEAGTWIDLFRKLRDLELRVVQSQRRELTLNKEMSTFQVGKGTAASTERWYMRTPLGDYYGDDLAEVITQVEQHYPNIWQWLSEFGEE